MATPSIRSIGKDDIQLLRYWRNLEHVRSATTTLTFISHQDQRDWHADQSANKARHFVYSIYDFDVSSFNLSNIDFAAKSFEGGIYCGNPDYLGHWINLWAYIQLYNIGFGSLDLETSTAKILTTNLKAISFNEEIGYLQIGEPENGVGHYVLKKTTFLSKTKPFKSWLKKFELSQPHDCI